MLDHLPSILLVIYLIIFKKHQYFCLKTGYQRIQWFIIHFFPMDWLFGDVPHFKTPILPLLGAVPAGPLLGPPEILEVALSVPSRHCATRFCRGDWPDGLSINARDLSFKHRDSTIKRKEFTMKNRGLTIAPAQIEDITSQNRDLTNAWFICCCHFQWCKSPVLWPLWFWILDVKILGRSKPWSLWSQICDPVCTCSTSGRMRTSVLSNDETPRRKPIFTTKTKKTLLKSIYKTRMAYHFEVTKWLSKSWTTHPPMWARSIARVVTPSCSWKLRWLPSQQKRGSEAAPVGQHDNFWRFISTEIMAETLKVGP